MHLFRGHLLSRHPWVSRKADHHFRAVGRDLLVVYRRVWHSKVKICCGILLLLATALAARSFLIGRIRLGQNS
jgi:hypothetical protein